MVETAVEKANREQREAEAAKAAMKENKQKLERSKRKVIRMCINDRNAFLALAEKTPSVENSNAMSVHLDSWKEALGNLSELDDELMQFVDMTKSNEEIEAAESEITRNFDTYKYEYNKAMGKLKTIQESLQSSMPSGSGSGRKSMLSSSFLDATLVNPMVKIQEVPIPKFDGKFSSFPDWYAEFSSVVDKNESFDDFQKLYLLKRSMGDGAENILKDIGTEGSLYSATFKNLYDTYYNRRRIIAEHFSSLVDMPPIKPSALRESVDKVKRALRGLKVCGINVEAMSPLIAYLTSRKIPDKLRTDWDNSNHDYTVYPSFDSLATFLINRSFSYETNISAVPQMEQSKGNWSLGNKGSNTFKGTKSYQSSYPDKKASMLGGANSSGTYQGPKCVVCQRNHFLDQCEIFSQKSVHDRFQVIKSNRFCLKCLKPNHPVNACKRNGCSKCSGNHHILLHRDSNTSNMVNNANNVSSNSNDNRSTNLSQTPTVNNNEASAPNQATTSCNAAKVCALSCNKTVFLSTAVVNVISRHGNELGRILLDQGSETSLVTREFCTRARLDMFRSDQPSVLIGINNGSVQLNSAVKCVLKSRFSKFSIAIEAEVIDKIPYKVNKSDYNLSKAINDFSLKLGECFELPYDDVDILLGSEYVEFVLSERRYFIEGICLRESYFGFVISGSSKRTSFLSQKQSFCGLSNSELSEQFRKFVNIDEVPESKKETLVEYDLIEKHFNETYSICNETGRFMLRLPLKPSVLNLKGSFSKARSLLVKNERRQSDIVRKAYIDVFNEYLSLGHMTKISHSPKELSYFLPHHMVTKGKGADISFRIVFNASSVDDSGSSLNDHFLQGPVLQPSLFSNVIRFREHIFAVCADISRMYRRILIHPEDRKYQQVLFRFDGNAPIDTYELNTLTNGIGPASYLATKCLSVISSFVKRNNASVANSISNDFYMDNYMSGSSSLNGALELVLAVHQVLGRYGFPLCKYQSNSNELLAELDEGLIDKRNVRSLGGEEFVMLLGLLWFNDTDTLGVNLRFDDLPAVITKRVILSDVSKIFDLLGILSPVTIRAKLILQELWKEGRMWDERVSEELVDEFKRFREDLKLLSSYVIDRCYFSSSPLLRKELIGFCDASTKAYCVVIYVRSIYADGQVKVSFLCSKCRVAPLKTANIHRLELMAANLLSRLVQEVGKELNITNVFAFSDSQVTLGWINTDPYKLKQFVSNRVSQTVSLISKENWFYIEGKSNPADLGTRGISAEVFLTKESWKVGPSWLSSIDEFDAYVSSTYRIEVDKLPELKSETCVNIVNSVVHPILTLLEKRSSLHKCISVVAYVIRYVRILKLRCLATSAKEPKIVSRLSKIGDIVPLNVDEREEAFSRILYSVQKEYFQDEHNRLVSNQEIEKRSKLCSLNVFLDPKGIIRVRGRTCNANFSYDTKFPIVLPVQSRVVELYVQYVHKRFFHATISFIINFVRSRFWIVGNFLSLVKKVVRQCVICTRINADCGKQVMGNLPEERVTISRPFSCVGVDLTGAINLKCSNHRSVKSYKVYLAFFVCLVTRAVHVEVVEDLTTEAFLNTIESFISRRGYPKLIYSDNATNFVGSRKVLEKSSLGRYLDENRIEWKTIAPRSPHQGGIWESAVKSGKAYILRAIGEQRLTLFELNSIATKVEAILNTRPLTYRKTNQFVEPLTPSHFLMASGIFEIPSLDDVSMTLRSRYFMWRKVVDSFWHTWRHDYFNQLRSRNKWKVAERNLAVGDVVLLVTPDAGKFSWPMAIVETTFPDRQGVVRNVLIRLANKDTRRTSVQNLILLPVDEKCINLLMLLENSS